MRSIKAAVVVAAVCICTRTHAFQIIGRRFQRAVVLSRVASLQAEAGDSKLASSAPEQAVTPSVHQETRAPKSLKSSKQRRWASKPAEGVEKRALAWIQNNRQIASTYDW